jgi:hypothetical protein
MWLPAEWPRCVSWLGRKSCLPDLQGKRHSFGTFKDRVSAAIRYDIEATKVHGEDAILNLPAGCNIKHSQPPVVPLGGRCGQGQPVANGSLPAGNVEGSTAPVPRSRRIKRRRRVSMVSWVVIRQGLLEGIRYMGR